MFSQVYEPKGYALQLRHARRGLDRTSPRHLDERTRLVWIETPTNPLLNIVDIRAAADAAHAVGALARRRQHLRHAVPAAAARARRRHRRPLDDEVPRRPLGRHRRLRRHERPDDRGAAALPAEVARRRARGRSTRGSCCAALKTLAVRMRQHCENARAVVAFLQEHPRVEQVLYPGLPSHPGHAIAARQMRDFGGMVSFLLESEEEAVELVARTQVWTLAESLGGVESLIEHPLPDDARVDGRRGPSPHPRNLVRLSVGIESAHDLVDRSRAGAGGSPARSVHASPLRTGPDRPLPRRRPTHASARTSSRPTTARPCSTAARRRHFRRSRRARGAWRSTFDDMSGTCCSRTSTSTTRAPPGAIVRDHPHSRCTSPRSARRISSIRAASRRARAASTATRSTRSGASSCPCRPRTCTSSATTCSGSSASPPGPRVAPRLVPPRDGTLYSGDAAGVRIAPGALRAAAAPPPEIDLEAWEATIAETERRAPTRLALVHFGVFDDVQSHSSGCGHDPALVRVGRARHGRGDVRRRGAGRRRRPIPTRSTTTPGRPVLACYRGLERYWRKRRETAP